MAVSLEGISWIVWTNNTNYNRNKCYKITDEANRPFMAVRLCYVGV